MNLPLNALLLILLGALCHATWNVYSKRAATKDVSPTAFIWAGNVVSLIVFAPLAVHSLWHDAHTWSPWVWCLITLSATLHQLYSVLLQQGYRHADYGVVYPLARGSGALFASLLAIVLLSEWPQARQWLGLGLIITGIFVVAGMRSLLQAMSQPTKDARLFSGLRYGVAIGGLIALYTVVDGFAVKRLALPALTYYWSGILVRTLLISPWALRHPKGLSLWRHIIALTWAAPYRRSIVVVGLLSPLAYWLALLAAQRAPVSFVAPLREVSMLFAMLLGAWLLKEKQPMSRIIGALLMVAGISFLI
ncbi:hypothetical protein DTO96_102291 [Ephemeroptericola cinctiostellae]|uniref:EamA domain-containing protein n=1 Tax=Ephemeroptericola cinctiostellae TaxID=2268024 RepID=A0A345DDU8_9BURK|nr:EamA family transporter [Ephemeroptericola cinctiostellae]AXF86536.1 hypothetical protein DTO96_102291 [Ephemeroptericola cinctiostellae]